MAIRNPLVTINDQNYIQNIGDAHLGRVFKNNVALDRRGEWEKKQMASFDEELFKTMPIGVENPHYIRVQAGDLFDKPIVSNEVLMDTVKILKDYEDCKEEPLYIISGNHDDSKNESDVTSWDLLAKFFEGSELIHFVKTWKAHVFPDGSTVLLVGWNIHESVATAYLQAYECGVNPAVVVCHLDRISYGNEDNVIPYDFLKQHHVDMVISGHEHKPYFFEEGHMKVIGTGSLLPYSHAEDPEGYFYQTYKGWDAFHEVLCDKGSDYFKYKHVRVYLEDEHMEDFAELNLSCYSLQVHKIERLQKDQELEGETEVIIESYNAKNIWQAAAQEVALPDEQSQLLWAEIEMEGIENE